MAAPLLSKDVVLDRIFSVFRTYGYEGATLARISQSTGLGRASLYHYFPGGKDEMAREVLTGARGWIGANIVATLDGNGSVAARLKAMTAALRTGYADGEASCVINLLGIGEAGDTFAGELRATLEPWLHALEKLLREAGVPVARGRRIAVDALVRIEGALVIARALRDNAVFVRTLGEVEKVLLEEATARG
jgi:AcrR family transcriptional regulator